MEHHFRTYGFRLTDAPWLSDPCTTIETMVREGDAPSPINPKHTGESTLSGAPKAVDGMMLAGLEARLWLSSSGVHRGDWAFHDAYSIGPCQSRAMSKTFSRIERALTTAGYPDDIGDWIEAVAKGIRASWWADETVKGLNSAYASSKWRFRPLCDLKERLRAQQRDYQQRYELRQRADAA